MDGDKDAGENKQVSIHYILGGTFRGQYIAPLDDNTKKSTISPLPLDVTGTTVAEKYYDGTTFANIDEEGALNTVLEGDKVNLVVTNARYASPDAGSHGVTADFSLSGRDAINYVLNATPQLNGVINPRQLTASSRTIEDTKVYDGNTVSRILSAGTLGNVVSGEEGNITFEASAEYDNENVGFHKPVTVTYTITEQGGKHNYIAPAASQSKYADITAKQLYVVDFEIDSTKVYDRNTTAVVKNNGSLTGVVYEDQGKVTISSIVANYNNSSVGDNKPVYVNFILGGERVANYKSPEAPANLVADITPKQLTATTPNVQTSKSYDGNTTAKVTVAQRPDGLIAPDQLGLRGTASYNDKEVGTGKPITVKYELTGDPTIIKNYIVPVDYQTEGSIAKSTTDTVRSGSISYEKVKTYDGTTSIVMIDSIGELSKKNTGDDVWAVATARYSDSKAENGKTIIIDYRLEGRDKDNYEVPETKYITGEGIIRPKQLSILSAPRVKDKVFDGTTFAELDGDVTLNGRIVGDDVDVSVTAEFDTAIVGNRQVVFTFSLMGDAKDNYMAPVWPGKVNARITKRQLHASAPALTTRKMYDGNTNAEVAVSTDMFTNLCAGYEDVDLEVISSKYDDAMVGTNKRITVAYRIKGDHAGNYSAPTDYSITYGEIYVNDVLTVEPGSVNFQNKKTYDGTDTIHVNNPGLPFARLVNL